jgi:hypothetical protein
MDCGSRYFTYEFEVALTNISILLVMVRSADLNDDHRYIKQLMIIIDYGKIKQQYITLRNAIVTLNIDRLQYF